MKCVILGGGGFIGSTIADCLLLNGYSVRVFERPRVAAYRTFEANEKIEWITGDFLSKHDIADAIDGADVVLHLISTTLPKSSNDDPIYDVQSNVVASLQLLDAMVDQDVRKIIFISSGGTVYGIPQYLPIDENHPTNPIVSYGITKLGIEKYLYLYERIHDIKPIILRVANPYGQRQRVETAQGAIAVFLHHALLGKPLQIWGDGNVIRDYIHICDVADAFVKAVGYSGSKSVFNISSGTGTSLNELVEILEELIGKPIERNYLPARPFDVPVSVLSNECAKTELNWAPTMSIREGIKSLVNSL